MQTRTERTIQRKREFRKQVLITPKLIFSLFFCLIFYSISQLILTQPLKGTSYDEIVGGITKVNIMAIGIFCIAGFTNIKILVVLIKSILKIMFTVWMVTIIQFSKLEQIEQNVWIILSSFFFVYLEVLLELNDVLFQIPEFQNKKIKFLNSNFLRAYSVPISIFALSLINILLSFFIIDLLKELS
ncbi:hypothetical protein SAMN05216312_1051 [Cohnella sp. OV330]|nr:hypothetical protein SAMN05216312_1051 [Cohnella sp. OV330]